MSAYMKILDYKKFKKIKDGIGAHKGIYIICQLFPTLSFPVEFETFIMSMHTYIIKQNTNVF